jgi:hypothetical protein
MAKQTTTSPVDCACVIHGTGYDWIRDFRIPQEQRTPPNHVNGRADDQNGCNGVFCSIALAFRRLRRSPTTVWSLERVDSVSSNGLSVVNCPWTLCPFGGWTVRSNNARTVVSKLFDWRFGIIPVDSNRVKSSQPTGFVPVVLYFEH